MNLRPFSAQEIIRAVNDHNTMTKAANALTKRGLGKVTVQKLRSWLAECDPEDFAGFDRAKTIAQTRSARTENQRLRRDIAALSDAVGTRVAFKDALARMVEEMPQRPPIDYRGFIGTPNGTALTVEVLVSDLQIGKLAPGYNTLVAKKRLFELGRAVLFQIEQKIKAGYKVERILLAILGDIIESDKKHKNSGRACDTGTAEQIYDAIEGLWEFLIEPLARLGIALEVHGIPGNHDHDDHGLAMFQPGRQQLSWPLYQSLALLTRRAGYGNVEWVIPEGSYSIATIYGQHVLYEHGVGVSVTEASMKAHKVKRMEQERKHITYFRMGDKHTVTSFNSGQMVVNGAFFGANAGGIEYSGIAGYSSIAAQWMGFHVQRTDNRLSLYDTFTIQLEHIGLQ